MAVLWLPKKCSPAGRVPLFSGLAPSELERIASVAHVENLEERAGAVVS